MIKKNSKKSKLFILATLFGFLFSYTLFFSMLYYILSKTGVTLWEIGYKNYILIIIGIITVYKLIKQIITKWK